MIEKTAIKGREQIAQVEKLIGKLDTLMKYEMLPKGYSRSLLNEIFKLPYTKRAFLVQAGIGSLKTVGKYLNELEKAGVLKSEQVGKEKLYLNIELLKILKQ